MIKTKGRCILGLGWKPLIPMLVVQLMSNLFMHMGFGTWTLAQNCCKTIVYLHHFHHIRKELQATNYVILAELGECT